MKVTFPCRNAEFFLDDRATTRPGRRGEMTRKRRGRRMGTGGAGMTPLSVRDDGQVAAAAAAAVLSSPDLADRMSSSVCAVSANRSRADDNESTKCHPCKGSRAVPNTPRRQATEKLLEPISEVHCLMLCALSYPSLPARPIPRLDASGRRFRCASVEIDGQRVTECVDDGMAGEYAWTAKRPGWSACLRAMAGEQAREDERQVREAASAAAAVEGQARWIRAGD